MDCEGPNERLYKFVGNMTMRDRAGNSVKVPLNAEQVRSFASKRRGEKNTAQGTGRYVSPT